MLMACFCVLLAFALVGGGLNVHSQSISEICRGLEIEEGGLLDGPTGCEWNLSNWSSILYGTGK